MSAPLGRSPCVGGSSNLWTRERRRLLCSPVFLAALGALLASGARTASASLASDLALLGQSFTAQGDGAGIDCTHPDVKDLPMCANAPPPTASAPAPKPQGPRNTKPTVGIAAHLWAFNQGAYSRTTEGVTTDKDEGAFLMRSTAGGAMVFLETRDIPQFALRAEFGLWFPKVERIRQEGAPAAITCDDCKWDMVLAVMMVGKVPIRIGKWVAIYPLLGAGFGAIFSLYHGREMVDRLGYSFALGVGVEGFPTAHVAPFFEFRYQLVGGRHKEETPLGEVTSWLHYHAVLLALGVRFH